MTVPSSRSCQISVSPRVRIRSFAPGQRPARALAVPGEPGLGRREAVVGDRAAERVLDPAGTRADPPAPGGRPALFEGVLEDLAHAEGAVDPLPGGAGVHRRGVVGLLGDVGELPLLQPAFDLARGARAHRGDRSRARDDEALAGRGGEVPVDRRVVEGPGPDLPALEAVKGGGVRRCHGGWVFRCLGVWVFGCFGVWVFCVWCLGGYRF